MKSSNINIISKQEAIASENSFSAIVKIISELTKVRITMLVSFTTGLGYVLASERIGYGIFNAIGGIFLLACASSVLNHYQEYDTDSMMKRTMNRPIPSGRVKPRTVFIF